MDVMTKVSLMHVYESYWDMLPPEIQEYIWRLKIAQMYIDAERKDMMKRLCREIEMYARVKEKWGLGHVKCVPIEPVCTECGRYHLHVYAYYSKTQYRYLGFNIDDALEQIDYVKFLFNH